MEMLRYATSGLCSYRINNEVWWMVIKASSSQIHSPIQDRLARRGGGGDGEAFERGGEGVG